MRRCIAITTFVLIALVCLGSMIGGSRAQQPPGDPLPPKVLPILKRCQNCHDGPNASAHLNLSSRASALKGGASGPALAPNSPETSLIYKQVAAKKMPPGN